MKNVNWMMTGGLLAATGLLVGCETEPAASEEVKEALEQRSLLTSVSLSETHKVDFWEYEGGDLLVKESLNVDRDFVEGRATLATLDTNGKPMADIYKNLAGGRADSGIVGLLGAADLRNLQRKQLAVPRATDLPAEEVPSVQGQTSVGLVTASQLPSPRQIVGNGVEKVSSAVACAEPAWDWQGDVGWFKNNFCGASSKFCATEVSAASYGWFRGPTNFKATGFAQSHCSAAHWLFQRKSYGGFPFYGIALATLDNRDLAPRTLDTEHWTTTGDRSWFAKVNSLTGNNRVGLAVIHN